MQVSVALDYNDKILGVYLEAPGAPHFDRVGTSAFPEIRPSYGI